MPSSWPGSAQSTKSALRMSTSRPSWRPPTLTATIASSHTATWCSRWRRRRWLPMLPGQFWGEAQVVHLTFLLHRHPTDHQITQQAGPRFSTPRGRVPSAGVGGRATCSCSLKSSTTTTPGCNWSNSVQATWWRSIARSLNYSTSRAVRVAMTPLPAPPLVA